MESFKQKFQQWKNYKKAFPNSSFITYAQLVYLVNKYNLCMDTLAYYNKDIPNSTVEILEKASVSIDENDNTFNINRDIKRIDKISIRNTVEQNIIDKIKKTITISPFITPNNEFRNDSMVERELELRLNVINPNIRVENVHLSNLNKSTFCIAAPQPDFIPNRLSFKVIKQTVYDPIVFQFTELGILVHDKWGEVLEDELFK